MQRQVRQVALLLLALAGVASADEGATRVEKDGYVASLAAPGEPRAGVPATVTLTLVVRNGFHMNADYPTSFKVTQGGSVTYPRAKIDRDSGLTALACADKRDVNCSARAAVPYIAPAAGTHTVGGVFAFSVCSADQCLIEKEPVSLELVVSSRQ